MDKAKRLVADLVTVRPGIHAAELAHRAAEAYAADGRPLLDWPEIIAAMVRQGHIRAVEYTMPATESGARSLFFPAGTTIRVR
jgi:hypothetical protein